MCRWEELNLRPALYEGAALTTELHRQMRKKLEFISTASSEEEIDACIHFF